MNKKLKITLIIMGLFFLSLVIVGLFYRIYTMNKDERPVITSRATKFIEEYANWDATTTDPVEHRKDYEIYLLDDIKQNKETVTREELFDGYEFAKKSKLKTSFTVTGAEIVNYSKINQVAEINIMGNKKYESKFEEYDKNAVYVITLEKIKDVWFVSSFKEKVSSEEKNKPANQDHVL